METTGSTPAFYLTPLARGKLAQARLEVYSHGRLVQQIPLPLKATRQRLTWILLLLTILIPPSIYYFTRRVDLSTTGTSAPAPAAVAQVAVEEEGQRPTMSDEELDRLQIEGMKKMGQKPAPGMLRRDRAGKKQATKAEPLEPQPKPVVAPQGVGRVEQATINVLPDFFGVTKWIAAEVQGAYDWAHNLAQDVYLSFYVGLGLLAFTILSWVMHAAARSSRRGEPIVLAT
jgi:hypothetical protein